MDSNVVHNLREWAPLIVLEKIPMTIFHGIFSNDLNITCIDAIPEFLVLGSDAGIVFWYNRYNAECQKLRVEVSSPITCIKVVSSVEYMIAVGTRNGQVNIFQIQKEIPSDLKLSGPFARTKPIQRYTIRELHKSLITCCEWSKNGMKLFTGDKDGLIVLTEFDYQNNISKSVEILDETYSIVQLCLQQTYLLVSTLCRTVICEPDNSAESESKWKVTQVGKTERKVLGEFGSTFQTEETKPLKLVACRPGFRFWLANCDGVVDKTFIFKDAPIMRPLWEIPLLNPNRKNTNVHLRNFTCIYPFLKKFYITNDDVSLYILNLEELQIEAIARNFREIRDYAVCGNEIFVLEGGRSLIRLSNKPEPPSQNAMIIFNPLLPPPIPQMGLFEAPIEFTEDEKVIGAEECFELPPIEPINSNILIQTHIDSPESESKKLAEELRKRFEILQKIGEQSFEKEIIYKSEKKYKKHINPKKNKGGKLKPEGIVEVGHKAIDEQSEKYYAVASTSKTLTQGETKIKEDNSITTAPQEMDASFCTENTNQQMEESVNNLKEKSQIDTIPESTEPSSTESPSKLGESLLQFPNWPSLSYPFEGSNIEPIVSQKHATSDTEHIIDSKNNLSITKDDINEILSEDLISQLSLNVKTGEIEESKNYQTITKYGEGTSSDINILSPDLGGRGNELKSKDMPKHLIIPSLFNLQNENNSIIQNETDSNDSNGSEWEFIDKNNKKSESETSNKLNDQK